MLNLLRKIRFPADVQIHDHLIPARTLKFAQNHHDIVVYARDEAESIIRAANQEANRIREQARQEIAESMQQDLKSIRRTMRQRVKALADTSARICIDISVAALSEFLNTVPDRIKIEKLVKALLEHSLSNQELVLECTTCQINLVQESLGKVISNQAMLRKWEVQIADDLQPFELRIKAAKGSEIQVSIENLMALYKREIENLQKEIKDSIATKGNQYEEVD
jgi:vacuolar-type H+-ATPase subunit H